MDAFYNGSLTITETVRQVLSSLYSLPPGYALTKAPSSVPPDEWQLSFSRIKYYSKII